MLSRYRETLRGWSDPVGRTLFRLNLRPNHLTLMGLAVSFVATAAFVAGRTRTGGLLLIVAGLCDFFDGSLARASGQVTPFGAFLDSVIDRYSDLLVMLGIVVFFASMAETVGGRRGALVAMAGLVGSIMVSYTKARAESIGIDCNVGFMERPERMICVIAGAVFDVLEPALWVLAVLANVTAIHRIAHTRRLARAMTVGVVLAVGFGVASAGAAEPPPMPSDETIVVWRQAVELHQSGDSSALAREFRSEGALKSRIGDYVRWYLAEVFSRRGQLTEARLMAASIAEQSKDSRLAPAGLLAAATLADRAGDDAGAQKLLARLIESYPDSAEMPVALYLLGLTGEARGQLDAAAAAYRELQILVPTSGWADGAGDRLAALARGGTRIPELSLAQRLDRAERLLKGGVPQTAVDEAERIVNETKDAPAALRALRIVSDAAQRLKKWDVAAKALAMAVSRAPNAQKPALLLEQGRLTARGKQPERALPIYATVVATGTEAEAAEAAYQRARILDDVDRDTEAAAAYRAVATRYPNREVAGASLWRLGWLAWTANRTREAGESWAKLAEISGGRSYRVPGLYWAGRARETGQRKEAERLFKRVLAEAPRSYYGLLAAHRVAGDAGNETAAARAETPISIALPVDPAEALADDPGYTRVDLLRRVGLVEDAVLELEVIVHRSLGDTVRLYSLSSAYVRDERYHLALRILRRHFTALATSGHPSLPQAFWEMLYPFGWRRAVTEAAEREGLDPFLVAALVREESSYYPRAISRAGARGLMQLMPRTAQLVANHGGIALQSLDTLDDPGINVDLGTRFLAGMLKEFRDPRLALAAYNAGPGRVRQWLKARPGDDIEAFVEQIPFDETRGYVKRVMLSWEEYKRIYGAGGPDMAPRTPPTLGSAPAEPGRSSTAPQRSTAPK